MVVSVVCVVCICAVSIQAWKVALRVEGAMAAVPPQHDHDKEKLPKSGGEGPSNPGPSSPGRCSAHYLQLKMHSKFELFNKTLPGASSFAQVDVTSQVMRSRAVE